MDETRAVTHLPNLDIEIVHRRLPDEGAEQLLVSLRTQPSLEAFARWFDAQGPAPARLALHPFLAWQRAALALWSPWLAAGSRVLRGPAPAEPKRGGDR